MKKSKIKANIVGTLAVLQAFITMPLIIFWSKYLIDKYKWADSYDELYKLFSWSAWSFCAIITVLILIFGLSYFAYLMEEATK